MEKTALPETNNKKTPLKWKITCASVLAMRVADARRIQHANKYIYVGNCPLHLGDNRLGGFTGRTWEDLGEGERERSKICSLILGSYTTRYGYVAQLDST